MSKKLYMADIDRLGNEQDVVHGRHGQTGAWGIDLKIGDDEIDGKRELYEVLDQD